MKSLVQESARLARGGLSRQTPFPVYVDLWKWKARASLEKLDALLKDELVLRGLGGVTLIRWYLDGLDVLNSADSTLILQQACDLTSSGVDIVLSARPYDVFMRTLNTLGPSVRVTLRPLRDEDRKNWVHEHCPTIATRLREFEYHVPGAASLLEIPLCFAMTVAIMLDTAEEQTFSIKYPGRAGLFHRFMAMALECARPSLTSEQLQRFYEPIAPTRVALEAIWWAAIRLGGGDSVPDLDNDIIEFADEALLPDEAPVDTEAWRHSASVMREARLMAFDSQARSWRAIHQGFAEYWAAQHLARRLSRLSDGLFELEFWEHFSERRLDTITSMAIGILSRTPKGRWYVEKAHLAIRERDQIDAIIFLEEVGSDEAVLLIGRYLGDEDTASLCAAIDALGRMGRVEYLENLCRLAEHTDCRIRDSAEAALRRMCRSSDVASLENIIGSRRGAARRAAIAALGYMKCKRAAQLLLSLMDSPEPPVLPAVIAGLGALQNDGTVPALLDALQSEHPERKIIGREALRALSGRIPTASLVRLLDDSHDSVLRADVLDLLAMRGDPGCLEVFARYVNDPNICVRFVVTRALSQYGSAAAQTLLIHLSKDRSGVVREETAAAFAKFKAAGQLVALLKDPDCDVQLRAAVELCALGHDDGVDVVYSQLRGRAGLTVWPILGCLARHYSDKNFEQALALFCERTSFEQERLRRLLAGLRNSERVPFLIQSLDRKRSMREVTSRIRLMLHNHGDDHFYQCYLSMATSDDPKLRREAAAGLRGLKDFRATATLERLLQDSDPDVSEAGGVALAALGLTRASDSLIDLLTHKTGHVRLNTISVLGKLGDPRAIHCLIPLLTDSDLRTTAALALAELCSVCAVGPLVSLLRSDEPSSAAQALCKLAESASITIHGIYRQAHEQGISYEQARVLERYQDIRLPSWDLFDRIEQRKGQRRQRGAGAPAVPTTAACAGAIPSGGAVADRQAPPMDAAGRVTQMPAHPTSASADADERSPVGLVFSKDSACVNGTWAPRGKSLGLRLVELVFLEGGVHWLDFWVATGKIEVSRKPVDPWERFVRERDRARSMMKDEFQTPAIRSSHNNNEFVELEASQRSVPSNCWWATGTYKEAQSLYRSDQEKAIQCLAQIAADSKHDWFPFTSAYWELSHWLAAASLSVVAESVRVKCIEFLNYRGNLLGIAIPSITKYLPEHPVLDTPDAHGRLVLYESMQRKAAALHRALKSGGDAKAICVCEFQEIIGLTCDAITGTQGDRSLSDAEKEKRIVDVVRCVTTGSVAAGKSTSFAGRLYHIIYDVSSELRRLQAYAMEILRDNMQADAEYSADVGIGHAFKDLGRGEWCTRTTMSSIRQRLRANVFTQLKHRCRCAANDATEKKWARKDESDPLPPLRTVSHE
jgi:HEAT repeat protein